MTVGRRSWSFPVAAFGVWRVVQGVALVALGGSALPSLSAWDAAWYTRVLHHGYGRLPGEFQPTAFFPLLPSSPRRARCSC